MQNSPTALGLRGTEEAVTVRLAGDRLPNVQRVDRDFDDLGVAADSVDFAITALNFHDLYNADPALAQNMLAAVKEVLKPGAVLGLIDHRGSRGNDNAALHRIEIDSVIQSVTEAGFLVAGMSDVLRVDSDDHSLGPFAPELGRNTDRIVLKLVKP